MNFFNIQMLEIERNWKIKFHEYLIIKYKYYLKIKLRNELTTYQRVIKYYTCMKFANRGIIENFYISDI